MLRRFPFRAFFGLFAVSLVACVPVDMEAAGDGTGGNGSGDDGGSGGSDDGPSADPGTCDAWKIAFCDATTRCSFDTKEECETDVGYVMCLEDAPVGKCADALDSAKCGELPKDCDPRDIADRTLPTQVCNDYQEAYCEWSLTCGVEFSLEACRSEQLAAQPCDEFTAVLPGYEDCLSAYQTLACDDPLPESCQGILRR